MRSTMGWEIRNGSRYYYRKQRFAGRVHSIYVGRGELAVMTATLDAMQREQNEAARLKQRSERNASDPLNDSIDALARLSRTMTEAVLIAGGFHQHRRQWRKQKA